MIELVRTHPPQPPMVRLADLVLRFGRVSRATLHPDGLRPESDTDHTVMLGLLAVAVARAHPELGLDVGLVAQLALVHDLPEALCGDTNTMGGLTPAKRRAKELAELAAGEEIYRRFTDGPLHAIASLLATYELAVDKEARFVRYVDKITPKLTHALNQGAAVAAQGVTPDELHAMHERQRAELREKYPELADVLDPILAEACAISEAAYREDNVTDLVTWPKGGSPSEPAEVPRHLRIAIANATRAFREDDIGALATINEDIQQLADAAVAWGKRGARMRSTAPAYATACRVCGGSGMTEDASDCSACHGSGTQ